MHAQEHRLWLLDLSDDIVLYIAVPTFVYFRTNAGGGLCRASVVFHGIASHVESSAVSVRTRASQIDEHQHQYGCTNGSHAIHRPRHPLPHRAKCTERHASA